MKVHEWRNCSLCVSGRVGWAWSPCSSCTTKIDQEFQQESRATTMNVKALILLIICTLTERRIYSYGNVLTREKLAPLWFWNCRRGTNWTISRLIFTPLWLTRGVSSASRISYNNHIRAEFWLCDKVGESLRERERTYHVCKVSSTHSYYHNGEW